MKNIFIYYSSFNIDSELAALILKEALNDSDILKQDNVKMLSYDRSIQFTPPAEFDTIHIVGPVFHSLHLETLLYKNPNATIIIFNIDNNLCYKEEILSRVNICKPEIHAEDNAFDFKDLTTLVINTCRGMMPMAGFLNWDILSDFIAPILKYKRFSVMNDIQESAIVKESIDIIKESIEQDLPFDFDKISQEYLKTINTKLYNKYIEKIRAIINRNFSLKFLVDGGRYMNVPSLNVSEEHAIAIMRLVSYSHDDVITYEDTSTHRVYRIFSKKNNEWLIKCLKPDDFWYEGSILMMKTEIPSPEKK